MTKAARFALTFLACAVSLPLAQALPDAEATAGRLLLRRNADAVVTVKGMLILKVIVGERTIPPQENKIDVSGTVITPSGLTVTSLSALDSQMLFEGIRARMAPPGMSMTLGGSEIKDLKLLLGDGTEVPVKVVWKDAARDLALLAPDGKGAPAGRQFAAVDLNAAPVSAQILGDYFDLSRASEDLKRVAMIRPVTVTAIVERPRRMLLVTTDSVGSPVFDAKGGILGVCLRFVSNGQPVGFVVVPSSDIVDAATQAANL